MMQPRYSTAAYRVANEHLVLGLTLLLLLLVIAISVVVTVCTSLIFVGLAVVLAYGSSRQHHLALMEGAYPVTPQAAPGLAHVASKAAVRIQPGPVEMYVTPSRVLNAYTFGLDSPKVIVLYSALLQIMDEDELRFIIGHEMGHVRLGHTWLNSLVGGMAGIPSSSTASALLTMAFLWWNRTCELSADRAGLLACGNPEKAISALVKLVAGPQAATRAGMEMAYRQIDAEDDTFMGPLGEAFASHPMLIRRINELRRYAVSAQYRQLQALVDQNSSI
jgi:Zn-dependent protease with chaperone function